MEKMALNIFEESKNNPDNEVFNGKTNTSNNRSDTTSKETNKKTINATDAGIKNDRTPKADNSTAQTTQQQQENSASNNKLSGQDIAIIAMIVLIGALIILIGIRSIIKKLVRQN